MMSVFILIAALIVIFLVSYHNQVRPKKNLIKRDREKELQNMKDRNG